LVTQVPGAFDVVISCDNALPHLLSDADLRLAVRGMWSKLRPGGLLLASLRDYDQILPERPRATTPSVIDGPEGRRIVFQVWDWSADERRYTLHLFINQQTGNGWRVVQATAAYRALLRDELTGVLRENNLIDITWILPEQSGYYQPIVTARRTGEAESAIAG
jgi:hypothetical protein